jgi:hypothetical protein
LRVA